MCKPASDRDRFAVLIPAKDEASTIQEIVRNCLRYSSMVLVLDGASTDGTARLAADAGAEVLRIRGKGKGVAIREGIPHVDREAIVFVDADGSHIVEDIPHLVQPILSGEADHVSASRLLGGSSELHGTFAEFLRLAGSAFITACINRRYGVRLSESQNGFRAIRTAVARDLDLRDDSTTIEQEMIMKTLKKGCRMAEVPSHEQPRQCGESHIRLRSVWWNYGVSLVKHLFFGR